MIEFNHIVVLHPETEIIHPSPDVKEEGCIPVLHGYAPATPCQAAQPYFEPMDSFLSGSQFHSCERETKKGTVLSTDNFAFVLVHLHLEFSLKGGNLGDVAENHHFKTLGDCSRRFLRLGERD